MDLINQGKGDVVHIWGTMDLHELLRIKSICHEANEDFYNPPSEFVKLVLEGINVKQGE